LQRLHHGVSRVGQLSGLQAICEGVKGVPNIHPIDISECNSGFCKNFWPTANHSYFEYPEFQKTLNRLLNGADCCEEIKEGAICKITRLRRGGPSAN